MISSYPMDTPNLLPLLIHNFNEWSHHPPCSLSKKFTCHCPSRISHNPIKGRVPVDLTLKMFLKSIWPSLPLPPLPWLGPHYLPHKPQHQLPNCSSYFSSYPSKPLLHTDHITASPCKDRSTPCIPCWKKFKHLTWHLKFPSSWFCLSLQCHFLPRRFSSVGNTVLCTRCLFHASGLCSYCPLCLE